LATYSIIKKSLDSPISTHSRKQTLFSEFRRKERATEKEVLGGRREKLKFVA